MAEVTRRAALKAGAVVAGASAPVVGSVVLGAPGEHGAMQNDNPHEEMDRRDAEIAAVFDRLERFLDQPRSESEIANEFGIEEAAVYRVVGELGRRLEVQWHYGSEVIAGLQRYRLLRKSKGVFGI